MKRNTGFPNEYISGVEALIVEPKTMQQELDAMPPHERAEAERELEAVHAETIAREDRDMEARHFNPSSYEDMKGR